MTVAPGDERPAGSPPRRIPNGVMLNAYPDSIGTRLADTVDLLARSELRDVFSMFYVLPTFFNSDLDRGFSIIDYDLNAELVAAADIDALGRLGVGLKFDLVANHLSVGSPQFADLVERGDESPYREFFIDWNEFWSGHGEPDVDGHLVPSRENLERLFMRKPGLPILRIRFPDGTDRFYWNTFYQAVSYRPLDPASLTDVVGEEQAVSVAAAVNAAIEAGVDPADVEFPAGFDRSAVLDVVDRSRVYLGQMDLNAESDKVWEFYRETLAKLAGYGAGIVRLDAFAYLHKEVGQSNFFNRPGTWEYLDRLAEIADEHGIVLLPEIHAEYGAAIHEELADQGYPIYDFFFPGLVIDAIDSGSARRLERWAHEVVDRGFDTITMLGCHDGIPVIDLRGGTTAAGESRVGLLDDGEIDATIERLLDRGGRIKNLYGPDGSKISYYQVNATFYSALGEDDARFLLARAVQLFMPGIPQIWYLDLFAGRNDIEAADRAGAGGHKEINRTNLSLAEIEERLSWPVVTEQLELLRLRNTSPAFDGELTIGDTPDHQLVLSWTDGSTTLTLDADLSSTRFTITESHE